MKRVSTAFVGQVSAASSPAIAKLKGRARATNDPTYVPLASSHRAQSRRRRDLVAIFLDALGGRAAVSELQLVQVRKAAELTTAAEAVRARVLAGDATADLDALVKLEGEARRAVRSLNINTHTRPQVPDLQVYLAAKAAERSSQPDSEAKEADDGEAEA